MELAAEEEQMQLAYISIDDKISIMELKEALKTYGIEIDDNSITKENNKLFVVMPSGTQYVVDETGISAVPEGLKTGDLVEYIPDTANYTWQGKFSGKGEELNEELSNSNENYRITNWRVLNINGNGTVDLICKTPTTGTVYLGDAQGYNNAVKSLNDACSRLYGNANKGIKGRSVKIEDIEDKMTEEALNSAYEHIDFNTKYGEKVSIPYTNWLNYPMIYPKENKSVINGVINNTGLGISEQSEFVVATDVEKKGKLTASTSLAPYQTYWYKDNSFMSTAFKEIYKESDETFYNLFMPQRDSTTYWVASRCVRDVNNDIIFSVRTVFNGNIHADRKLYTSRLNWG